MHRFLAGVATAACVVALIFARQSAAPTTAQDSTEDRIAALEGRVAALETQVAALTSGSAATEGDVTLNGSVYFEDPDLCPLDGVVLRIELHDGGNAIVGSGTVDENTIDADVGCYRSFVISHVKIADFYVLNLFWNSTYIFVWGPFAHSDLATRGWILNVAFRESRQIYL